MNKDLERYKDKEKRRKSAVARTKKWRQKNLKHCAEYQANYYRKNPVIYLLSACRARCQKNGIPFDLVKEDIVIPEICPVLGIPLMHGTKPFHNNSPSIDRLIPDKGYTKGNVYVISFRANKIKQDATAAEIRAVADWIDKMNTQGFNTTRPTNPPA